MNPNCFICEGPSERVCIHPLCIQPPFLCNGPCVKGSSEKIHTHNREILTITCRELFQKLYETNQVASNMLKEHNQIIQKKALRIKTSLDTTMSQHQSDLMIKIEQYGDTTSNPAMKKANSQDWLAMTGKQISQFLKNSENKNNTLNQNNNVHFLQIKHMIMEFENMLDDFQKRISNIYSSETRSKKGVTLEIQGWDYFNQKKWSEAYQALSQCSKYYPHKQQLQAKLGICCMELELYEQAASRFQKAIQLNPSNNYYNNLGNILVQNLQKFDEAIQIYSKAIDLDPTNAVYYNNRGIANIRAWNFGEAVKDFSLASELEILNKEYKQNLKKSYQLLQIQLEASIKLEENPDALFSQL